MDVRQRGNDDILVARRDSRGEPFSDPELVAELSSDSLDWATWVSGDGCRIILSSDRPNDVGSFDSYEAEGPR